MFNFRINQLYRLPNINTSLYLKGQDSIFYHCISWDLLKMKGKSYVQVPLKLVILSFNKILLKPLQTTKSNALLECKVMKQDKLLFEALCNKSF